MAYLWNKKLDAEAKRKDRKKNPKRVVAGSAAAKLPAGVRKSGTKVHSKKTANKGPSGQMKRQYRKKKK